MLITDNSIKLKEQKLHSSTALIKIKIPLTALQSLHTKRKKKSKIIHNLIYINEITLSENDPGRAPSVTGLLL